MLNITLEIAINIFQSIMYMGFLFLFLDKPDNNRKNIVAFSAFSLIFFCCVTYITFFVNFLNPFDFIFYILIMEAYSIFFLKGNIFEKSIMPVIAYLINTVISYVFSYAISLISHESYYDLLTKSTVYRDSCIIFINLINAFVFFLLVKLKTKELKLVKWTDLVTFILIPIVTIVIIYSTLQILYLSNFKSDILIFLLVICVCMIFVAAITWIMMTRISKENEMETQLLLINQKSSLYEANIIQTNGQIAKMSKIKHDIKNHLLCIGELLESDRIDEAKKICNDVSDKLANVYTPINTPNALLNAVINVELEKASNDNIVFTVLINDSIMEFAGNTDLISIIGNICDNAIEYLRTVEQVYRGMILEISRHNSYCVISCKNKIVASILENNPELFTHKNDTEFHGKGIGILKAIVKKYDGEIKFYEKEGYFYSVAILKL